jgi:hypothetical protein
LIKKKKKGQTKKRAEKKKKFGDGFFFWLFIIFTWGKGRDNRRASLRLLACEKATRAAAG